MNKVKNSYLLFVLVLLPSKVVNSQVICTPDKIYGDWYYIRVFNPVKELNVDSLKNTVMDTSLAPIKLSFLENGMCITKRKDNTIRTEVYRVDSLNCKIIYGKRKKTKYYNVVTIDHLDKNCLFFTRWNPHGPWTHFYYRK